MRSHSGAGAARRRHHGGRFAARDSRRLSRAARGADARGRRSRRSQRRTGSLRRRTRRGGVAACAPGGGSRRGSRCGASWVTRVTCSRFATARERESWTRQAMQGLVATAKHCSRCGPAMRNRVRWRHGDLRHQWADRRHHRDSGRLLCADGHRLCRRWCSVRAGVLGVGHGREPTHARAAASPIAGTSRRPRITATRRSAEYAGATVTALNDEHATIALPADSRVEIGDRVELLPSHTDPTINLHDMFYVVAGRPGDRHLADCRTRVS